MCDGSDLGGFDRDLGDCFAHPSAQLRTYIQPRSGSKADCWTLKTTTKIKKQKRTSTQARSGQKPTIGNSRPRRRLRGLCGYRWSERRVQPAAVVRHRVRAVGVPEERRVHVAPKLRVRVLRRRHGAHHACGHEQRPDRSAKRCLLVPQLLLDLEPIDASDREQHL